MVMTMTINKIFLMVLALSLLLGVGSGYLLANKSSKVGEVTVPDSAATTSQYKNPQSDNKTFRDFAGGTIQKRPISKNKSDQYAEGSHILIRESATPVALTSSVVDLSEYEGKKVKVFGETQKAIKEGWLMDVGKVEVEN